MRRSLAVASGFWLYYVAVVLFGSISAAWSVPAHYFALFGTAHRTSALALHSLATWALPVSVLVCAGTLATHVLLLRPRSVSLGYVLAGLVLAYFAWAILGYSNYMSPTAAAFESLRLPLVLPWWNMQNFVAPWVGYALAVWVAKATSRPGASSEA